jgi:hypothetical protein
VLSMSGLSIRVVVVVVVVVVVETSDDVVMQSAGSSVLTRHRDWWRRTVLLSDESCLCHGMNPLLKTEQRDGGETCGWSREGAKKSTATLMHSLCLCLCLCLFLAPTISYTICWWGFHLNLTG